mmetsp:Transcript_22842/g.34623  ORF Transcript_22842/g.34623 Transcript_22842/m.34623 type:complete len:217 (-) Transcript_22842:1695-2345(-)
MSEWWHRVQHISVLIHDNNNIAALSRSYTTASYQLNIIFTMFHHPFHINVFSSTRNDAYVVTSNATIGSTINQRLLDRMGMGGGLVNDVMYVGFTDVLLAIDHSHFNVLVVLFRKARGQNTVDIRWRSITFGKHGKEVRFRWWSISGRWFSIDFMVVSLDMIINTVANSSIKGSLISKSKSLVDTCRRFTGITTRRKGRSLGRENDFLGLRCHLQP